MKYKFYKETLEITGTIILGVMPEKGYETLFRFGDHGWNSHLVQEIIDGVETSRTSEERYEWSNEDVHLVSNQHGVFFFDLIARRFGQGAENQDLQMSHDEFIEFLQDFKKFVEENS